MTQPSYRALLVGNSRFPMDGAHLPDLHGPPVDVAVLRDALTHPELGLFEAGDVRVLVDRDSAEIMRAMEAVFRGVTRDDRVLLYYSGHGWTAAGTDLYLCANDSRTDYIVSTAISDVVVDAMMRYSRARTFVIVLDCCFSGRWKGGNVLTPKLRSSGRFVVASSRAGQMSADAPAPGQASPFTRLFADALVSPALGSADGYLYLSAVYDYVLDRLDPAVQTPQRQLGDAVGDVPIARRSAARAPAPSASPGPRKTRTAPQPQTQRPIGELTPDYDPGRDLYNHGVRLYRQGEWKGAANAYQEAAALGDACAAHNLGDLLQQQGDIDGAIEAFRHADRLGDGDGAHRLGLLLRARGEDRAASEALRRGAKRGLGHVPPGHLPKVAFPADLGDASSWRQR